MKYYKVKPSIISKEVGKSPQCTEVKFIGSLGKQEYYNLGYYGPIENIPELPVPIIRKGAKDTTHLDVVAIDSNIFEIFKGYFIHFLEDFNLGAYNIWPIQVHYKKAVLNEYCLFHISTPSDMEVVNYSQSEFLIGKLGDWKDPSTRKPIKVENHNNYLSLLDVLKESEKDSQIRCNKLVLDFSKTELDILRLINVPFGAGYYISEKLKNAIERKRFTGMDFIEIEEYEKRIKVM